MAEYTREFLIKKTARFKAMSEKSAKGGRGAKHVFGTEHILDTEAGRVRTLCYGLEREEKLPLFVNIHGGGFILGHPEMDDPYMPRVSVEGGVKIISVDWSHSPEHPFPVALNECYAVVKYAQTHPDEFGIDASRVAVGGHSAGGNYTAAICLLNAERRELAIRCAILDYPPLDIYTEPEDKPPGKGLTARIFLSPKMAGIFNACYCLEREDRKNPLVSPVYASAEKLAVFPPTLVITAGKDSLCDEGERFAKLLEQAGADVTYRCFEKSPHGFTLSNRPDAREGWGLMIEFLTKHLG